MKKRVNIVYIGGGSRQWARIFMTDLALQDSFEGEIRLYDIDNDASRLNARIGERINENKNTKSKFDYKVFEDLPSALNGADFVIISILPGTFEEMRSDVHLPERHNIFQSVGDTAGPGGVVRALRTVPIFQEFARDIKKNSPNAWVINLTNPMSILVKTLFDEFPEIKCFGCCHEVFHAQDFLTLVAEKVLKIERPNRKDIYFDACGVNHFTWISEAYYQNHNLLDLIDDFYDKYFEEGYYEGINKRKDEFKYDCFAYGNKVKMDLYKRFKLLPAAGDRHLVEFVPQAWYLKDEQTVKEWAFNLTTVDFRITQFAQRKEETVRYAEGIEEFEVKPSGEEVVALMEAILGYKTIISNVNYINLGQMHQLPLNDIVETNCVFSLNSIKPITSKPLNQEVLNLVSKASININTCYEGIKQRDLYKVFASFMNQELCSTLSFKDGEELFKDMIRNTRKYLDMYYDIDAYLNK